MRFANLLCACAATLLFSAIAQAGQIDNPAYKEWSSFKVGSSVTMRTTHGEGAARRVSEVKNTLAAVNPDECEITSEVSVESGGSKKTLPSRMVRIPRQFDDDEDNRAKVQAYEKATPETVNVSAGKFETKLVRQSSGEGNEQLRAKVWVSSEVPGGAVKAETYLGPKSTVPTSTIELIAVDKK